MDMCLVRRESVLLPLYSGGDIVVVSGQDRTRQQEGKYTTAMCETVYQNNWYIKQYVQDYVDNSSA